ncbi:MAG: helicase-exonuclease AddAB subunit AddA [bacterium]|nr:helicase-exonuclease AddAB subunit AddA [bacterium]
MESVKLTISDQQPAATATGGTSWTPAQQRAIDLRGSDILVSAAAGAGKTAVLVERIIQHILKPGDIDDIVTRILVVTFTEAAAMEMRSRIIDSIRKTLAEIPEENERRREHLHRQMVLAEGASISTLHAFCLKIVRQYYYRLEGLDPAFGVMDADEADLLRLEVLESLYEESYSSLPGFTELLEYFGGQEKMLTTTLLKLYDFAWSQPWPLDWLDKAASAYDLPNDKALTETRWLSAVIEETAAALAYAAELTELNLHDCCCPGGPVAYASALQADVDTVGQVLQVARGGSWDDLMHIFEGVAFVKLAPVRAKDGVDERLKERVQERRKVVKRIVDTLQQRFNRPVAMLAQEIYQTAPLAQTLTALVKRFASAFFEAKQDHRLVDFNDLEHLCLKLLLGEGSRPGCEIPSEVALELKERFEEVLVDEYQDINELQDTILRLVSRRGGEDGQPNLFMVGDVKQSIYRFRLADPAIFQGRYNAYPSDDGRSAPDERVKIILGDNFRSRRTVIDGVNLVFKQIMTAELGGIDYDENHRLKYGAFKAYADDGEDEAYYAELEFPETELWLCTADEIDGQEGEIEDDENAEEGPEDLENIEREGRLIARRIRALMGEGPEKELQVYDKRSRAMRPVRYSDMAILLRSTKIKANLLLEELRRCDIPAYADLGGGYFNAVEVETMFSLLQIIDNPRQDIHLAAVLRSPLVGLHEDDLARIRLADRQGDYYDALQAAAAGEGDPAEAVGDFLFHLDQWRTTARRQPLADLIQRIYAETGYLAYVGGLPGGGQRRANLRALYDRARQFGGFSRQNLFRFLRFIENLRQNQGDLGTAGALGESEDVVRIMSIHKSKGLEFPVVFLADLGKRFNLDDTRGDVLIHRGSGLGLGLSCYDRKLRLRYPTLAREAVAAAIRQDSLAEELRVLYVAMTRARERLIMTASIKKHYAAVQRWSISDHQSRAFPLYRLAAASGFLDWLMPALLRHRDGGLFLASLGLEMSPSPEDILEDQSAWKISLVHAAELQRQVHTGNGAWSFLKNLEQPPGSPDSGVTARLDRALGWKYPFASIAGLPQRVRITEIEHLLPGPVGVNHPASGNIPTVDTGGQYSLWPAEELEINSREPTAESAGHAYEWDDELLEEPKVSFAFSAAISRSEGRRPGAAAVGTINHLVLQHLNLDRALDEVGIALQIQQMTDRGLLRQEETASILVKEIATFFCSDLGRRILAERHNLRRELPFSLLLPAAEVYPDIPPDQLQREHVSLYGIIDCLVPMDDGYMLIDYKTDRLGPEEAETARVRYTTQMRAYSLAVERITCRRVLERWIYLLRPGAAVRI